MTIEDFKRKKISLSMHPLCRRAGYQEALVDSLVEDMQDKLSV